MFIPTSMRIVVLFALAAGCTAINPPREDDAAAETTVDAPSPLDAPDAAASEDAAAAEDAAQVGPDAPPGDGGVVTQPDVVAPEASVDVAPEDVAHDVPVDTPAPCPAGQSRCGESCVTLGTDLAHCGACGRACDTANGSAACVDGACRVAMCNAGYVDCDMSASNGCEVTLPPPTGPFDAHAFWPDVDRDGEGDGRATPTLGCAAPMGFVDNRRDCDDGNAMISTRSPERCNGVDDNCDMQPDETCPCVVGRTEPCYGGPTGTSGVGACRGGMRQCIGSDAGLATWSACSGQVTPAAEVCDGVDNDCDGMTDEGLGTLSCGVGACRRTVSACVGGRPQSCAQVSPTSEVCDNIDNNCNGQIDDSVVRGCYSGPGGTVNVGRCRGGTQTCGAGAWGAACSGEVTPTGETCNNVDDDCDNQTDEGLTAPCQIDTCSGTSTCSRGVWSCSAPRRCPSGFSGSGSTCVGTASFSDSRSWSQGDARSYSEITTIGIPTNAASTGQVDVTLRFSQSGPSCSGQGGCGTSGEFNNYVNCDGGSQYNVSAGMFAAGSSFTIRCDAGGRVYIGKTVNGQCCCSSCTRTVTLTAVRYTAPSCRY